MDPLYLGIEIGGTKLQLAVGCADGTLLALRRTAVDPSAQAAGIQADIERGVPLLLAEAVVPRSAIVSAGIGFGGPVDADRGVVITSNQIDGWGEFPLADWVRDTLGIAAVALQNDADTAGLGEALFGAGAGFSPILYVTVGSGIGGGLIVDGKIYRGSGLGACEIGHLWVEHEPETRTLEQVASGWSIARAGRAALCELKATGTVAGPLAELSAGDPDRVTGAIVSQAAAAGDPHALALMDRATRAMARALAHAVNLLAPRRVILGGGVSLMPRELWFDPIANRLSQLVFPPFRGSYDLTSPALGEAAVVHGALALARRLSA